ncbi:MAG: cohesin domain-containing protein [Candidatus Uhrbacteria bacterium]
MQKAGVFVLGLAIALSSFANVPLARAAGASTFWLSSSSAAPAVGSTFTVTIAVNPNGESLDTARANLSYPPTILEGERFDLGAQFTSLSPGYSINNAAGTMSFGAFRSSGLVTASGTMATVTFRVLAPGAATIAIGSDSKLINDGVEKVSTAGFGKITVSGSGDATSSKDLESQALVNFGAFAGHMPASSVDWDALHCMAYDTCYPMDPALRNVKHEAQSLVVFGAKYGHIPVTSMDWKALHAIAYTSIFYDWTAIDAQ